MNEIEINNKTKTRVNLKIIRQIAEKFLTLNKINNIILSIAFIGDKEMRRLNNKYRRKNRPTDILSFTPTPKYSMYKRGNKWRRTRGEFIKYSKHKYLVWGFTGKGNFLGEIIMDYAQIRRQAKTFGNKVDSELCFILIHGLLHLLGHDDKTEKGKIEMEKLGNKFFRKLVL